MKKIFTLVLFSSICLLSLVAVSQQIAFPGAEGAGRFTSGGRGTTTQPTTVLEVTKLTDDNSTGTLRWALGQSATFKTIVFRVSGTIHLDSLKGRLLIRSNTTIAGQTAPGDGICIADMPVVISGDNVIVRFLRIRMGDRFQKKLNSDGTPSTSSGNDDAFGNLGNKNIIVDHCSISWSSDEACTIYRGDSVTLQYNIISEPLDYSYHFEGGNDYQRHGYGGIWGARRGSFHHNLIAHANGRTPRFAGNSTYSAGTIETCDFRNNVIYNWLNYNTNGGEGGNYNLVNNYYKHGPNTSGSTTSSVPRRGMIMNPSKSSTLAFPKLYVTGNHVDFSTSITNSNWLGIAFSSGSLNDSVNSKVTEPFDLSPFPVTHTALQAYDTVLAMAGAILPKRDTLDQRIVQDVRNRTGKIIDVQGGYPHGTPYPQTVNAWPTLASAPAPIDTDLDGMPDSWETEHGSDPNNAADRNVIDNNGYTKLENYLNGIVELALLPVRITSFSGIRQNNQIVLNWTTTNEVNADRFVVERSSNGTLFTPLIHIAAMNRSSVVNQYTFSDKQPLAGTSYYRLKTVDKDGQFAYSTILPFNRTIKNTFSLIPNPVTSSITLSHAKTIKGASFRIYSTDGSLIRYVNIAEGAQQTSVDAGNLLPGNYRLIFQNENDIESRLFIKR